MINHRIGTKNRLLNFPKAKASLSGGRPDWFLIFLVFGIMIFGLVMLSSASSVDSYKQYGDTYYLFKHQIIFGLLPGLFLFFLLAKIDYRTWEKRTVLLFAVSIILLILVFIPGLSLTHGSAKSWIKIAGSSFQPAEFVKLLLILSLAGWFSYRGKAMNEDFWNGLVPFTVMFGLVALLIVAQPDFGTLLVVGTIALAIYFAAGAKIKHMIGLVVAGMVGAGFLFAQAPYRIARLMIFLHPELDPQGTGYHINQALLAIGSGGIFGLGFGQSQQKFAYLPEVMGDSIFAIVSEELGFIFAMALVVAFLVLAWRGFKLAMATTDDYARFIVVGIITWFIFQSFYNIAAIVGLMPLTGIPLPFVSYGGTALFSNLAAFGILINISKHYQIK
ncbi:MAG: putative lipid II flippase FtsW [Candidatus Buchananbacteria bacterium]